MGRHGQSLLRHDHAHSQVSAPVLPAPQFTQFLLERFDISDMPISRATSACLSFVRCLAPSLSQPLATFSYLPTHLPSTGPTGKSYLPTIWDYRYRATVGARVKTKRSYAAQAGALDAPSSHPTSRAPSSTSSGCACSAPTAWLGARRHPAKRSAPSGPVVCGGDARIASTRVRLWHAVCSHSKGAARI
jgi:hypothetical protein